MTVLRHLDIYPSVYLDKASLAETSLDERLGDPSSSVGS